MNTFWSGLGLRSCSAGHTVWLLTVLIGLGAIGLLFAPSVLPPPGLQTAQAAAAIDTAALDLLDDRTRVTLSDPAAVNPSFPVDKPGDYAIRLVVNDGSEESAPDTVAISTLNSAPVANAGPDRTAFVGATVALDGSGSTDVDGQPLT